MDQRRPNTVTGMTPWRARRFLAYFALFVALFPGLAVLGSRTIQSSVLEPACRAYGAARGLTFVSYSKGGGDLLNLGTSYSTMSCYYTAAPNNVAFREVADNFRYNIALYEGPLTVVAGFVVALFAVVGIAWGVETAVGARASPRPLDRS